MYSSLLTTIIVVAYHFCVNVEVVAAFVANTYDVKSSLSFIKPKTMIHIVDPLLLLHSTSTIEQHMFASTIQRRTSLFSVTQRSSDSNDATVDLLSSDSNDMDNEATDDEDDDDYEFVEFNVTPRQIKILRKEADKRRANRRLTTFLLPINEGIVDNKIHDDDDDNSDESNRERHYSIDTLVAISELLENSELIEVRGISTNHHKLVRTMTDQLVYELNECSDGDDEEDASVPILNKPVVPVEINGYRAVLYSPFFFDDDEDDNDNNIITDSSSSSATTTTTTTETTNESRIQQIKELNQKSTKINLHTSYKINQWKKRPRGVRDHRGQIMVDENGQSIRK